MLKVKGKIKRLAVGLLGGLLALGWLATTHAAEGDKPGRVPIPTVKIEKGEKCVEPTDEMRRNHMNMLLHQRDKTMHQGIRTVRHSLKNCIDCHANPKTNSVLGKDGFCESCHTYSAVSMDCFECHSSAPQKKAGDVKPVAALSLKQEQIRPNAAPSRQTTLTPVPTRVPTPVPARVPESAP